MDGQHSGKQRSHTAADRTSALSPGPRISSRISESTQDLSHRKAPQTSAHGDRPAHPPTILLRKSNSSQAALGPQTHHMFLEKAYNAAICFKMLRDLNGSDPIRLKYIVKKIKSMAYKAPNLVLETIHDYFADNPEISNRHKFRLFHILETIIGASDALEETWEQAFMKLALENMTKSTELDEAYQDAAGNVLVAICRHSWRAVAQHLEAEVLTGVFPHRSLLYVMGVLTSKQELLNQEEKACWEEWLIKIAFKSTQFLKVDVWSRELLWVLTRPDRTVQEQAPEKAFLFVFYGLVLQAEDDSARVRTHLGTLLGTSHQWPKQREGIALTVGLTAVRHLDHVWAALEQFGRSSPIKCSLHSFSPKAQTSEDLRWKWASSTLLLAYGQMAVKAKAHILPWVDNILSRMIFFFRYSSWDETLKQSFLTAILMLVGAVSRSEAAHSYQFSQIPELSECLMVLMEKEPKDTLCTPTRQQTIHIICSLCKLRPPLNLEKKSRLLTVCLRSVLALPLLDVLEKHTCLFLEPPDVQNLYSQTSEALDQMLQTFITQNPTAEELHFLLSHLYVWLASEKAHERQRAVNSCMSLLKFLSNNLYLDPKEDFKRIGQLMGMLGILCQDPDKATQHSSLEGLGHLYQLLLRQRAEASRVKEPVPKKLVQAGQDGALLWSSGDQKAAPPAPPAPREAAFPKDQIFQLSSHQVTKEVMKHLTLAELTDLIWTAVEGLGSTSPFRVQAAASMLLTAVQEHGAQLETVANLGQAIHLQLCSVRIPQAKDDALQAITLLARNHTPELVAAFLDFSITLDSMSLEALKSLLFTTGHCQDFARLELQDAWDLFTNLDTYPQGVGLLARAMVQSPCRQIKAVASQLLPSLQSQEERARKVAILILNEFLYSPALLEVLPARDALMVLAQSIRDPSPAVRVLSLQGLGNILFHPEKGSLLRGQLPLFLKGFFRSSEPVVVRVMGTVADALHRLGAHGAGAHSLPLALNARSFFDDERDAVRAAAIALFGDLVAVMAGREPSSLRTQVHQGLVPLLLHLRDRCPAVATRARFAFYRCAALLRWRLPHTLFCALAWERGLSARHFLWSRLMTQSQEELSIHLSQALSYLHSCSHRMRTWAALFLGYTTCYHTRAVSQLVSDAELKLLLCTFENLKKEREPGIRGFATSQCRFLRELAARRQ
ncbi:maestro heat-like repeat family member 5 isoform X4 [Eptesicus fuscus]|uniref:maestro heat-like repeat family member 5 isoform X4 n=1 Tax=Eptesicus fuscus TaxID=29078 RepID=UPI0024040882|nr:maestro heat-like repeat family member 5 isoform X4 [Eptesicus fuscus]